MSTVEEILMVKGPDVIVASSDTTVLEAAKLMAQANVGSVIVKDGAKVSGIFTERDLLKRVVAAGKSPERTLLSNVMSSPVHSCRLDDEVKAVAAQLRNQHIRHLAIVEGGALLGLIGLRDVMAAELRDKDDKIRELQESVGVV